MSVVPSGLMRLRGFVEGMTRLVDRADGDEQTLLAQGAPLLERLIAVDDWLPEEFARSDTRQYRQYLLHCDPLCRFSVVSFVWGPGQTTPIHDHTTWGLVGVLRGAEVSQGFSLQSGIPIHAEVERIEARQVTCVSPSVGDIHQVTNAMEDRVSISIHVYGGNIGSVRRNVYKASGEVTSFVSGYHNNLVPNLWLA